MNFDPKDWLNRLKSSAPVDTTLGFMKAHPYQSAGLGVLGASNLAGLFDNKYVGGQLGGAALGGLVSTGMHALRGATGLPLAWAPLIGGGLGALFDKSREAKAKALEQQQQFQPY